MADLNDIYMRLGSIQADQSSMKDDIMEIKAQVKEVRDFKIRVLAWCTAASAGVTAALAIAKESFADIFRG